MQRAFTLVGALAASSILSAQQANRPAITGIAFARFYTTDLPATERFYSNTLGFEGRQVSGDWIYPVDQAQWMESAPSPPPSPIVRKLNAEPSPSLQLTGGMDHFSLGVAHVPDVVAALERNKCEGANCTKTQIGRDSKVLISLFSPDLTRVEFMEFTPTREPCCSPFTGKRPSAEEER